MEIESVYDTGFDELQKLMEEYLQNVKEPLEILEIGAKALVNDVRKLPKPRSSVNVAGYTHLLDTVTYEKNGDEIEVGWGKYFGPMVERGTKKMPGTAHMAPTFERNKEKYYQQMIEKINGGK